MLLVLLTLATRYLLSGQVNLLALVADRRFQDDLLLWVFESSGVITMVIDHVNVFDGLDSIIWVVEVLGSLIEHVDVVGILKLLCLLMNLIAKFKVLIKTSSS